MILQTDPSGPICTTKATSKCSLPEVDDESLSPVEFVRQIIPAELEPPSNCSFVQASVGEGYTMEAVGAIRNNDVVALRYMLEKGHSFDACNTNGETLLHLACRRSEPEVVEFLVQEAKVRANVRDNMGRTILHDVCWKSTADTKMMTTVLRLVPPELLLARDIRGHTPFHFARRQHWNSWLNFLSENKDMIREQLHSKQ